MKSVFEILVERKIEDNFITTEVHNVVATLIVDAFYNMNAQYAGDDDYEIVSVKRLCFISKELDL